MAVQPSETRPPIISEETHGALATLGAILIEVSHETSIKVLGAALTGSFLLRPAAKGVAEIVKKKIAPKSKKKV